MPYRGGPRGEGERGTAGAMALAAGVVEEGGCTAGVSQQVASAFIRASTWPQGQTSLVLRTGLLLLLLLCAAAGDVFGASAPSCAVRAAACVEARRAAAAD